VLIAQLRRKLGDPPLIHTVRGFGYLATPHKT
jgi:DNA-binding response OmpR family regulator